ncbi:uroporphyrinogen-III synthase [Robiginitalea sp. SC105]|uniref:uroporphyrinogen-III synthase n=1 Tax=Robiginitalea sp. SC105 TaxID=2762332 RepID=UPI001639C8CD|nr:uroporphyrinogen-III synthase [Robiginitalea sp. SC105]MBC2838336.1 uroporphyrinogen-III synthase [Robiginitalea sp. SC105]
MMDVLSTKQLTDEQQALLPETEFYLEHYDALKITYLEADLHSDDEALCIFTSSHAIEACFPKGRLPDRMLNCFCVGRKTAARLEEMGHRILAVEDHAEALAGRIISKYPSRSFLYFCGSRRLDTLPDLLGEAGVRLEERVVYRTGFNDRLIDRKFDAILFYSPSGVESFLGSNSLGGAVAICIGPTTARAIKKHTDKYLIAETPSVEGVLLAVQQLLESKHEG